MVPVSTIPEARDGRPAPGRGGRTTVSRRSFLALGLGVPLLLGVAACTPPGRPRADIDALRALVEAAVADAALADLAASGDTARSADLGAVSAHRFEHAAALRDEISRLTGAPTDAETSASTTSGTGGATTGGTADIRIPSLTDVRAALAASAGKAREAALDSNGATAALLGGIAASCGADAEVVLA